MAVFSSFNVRVFPSLVRSSSKVDLSAKIRLRPTPAIFPSTPVISLKPGSRRTATLPVQAQAQHRCASESELIFYPHRFAQILTLLPTLPDVRARCRQIERYGQHLPCLPTPFVTASNRVEGLPMTYNTYAHALLDSTDPSIVYFYFHSDAAHIRGLAVILVAGLSGRPCESSPTCRLRRMSCSSGRAVCLLAGAVNSCYCWNTCGVKLASLLLILEVAINMWWKIMF